MVSWWALPCVLPAPRQLPGLGPELPLRNGIAAESPQDLHWQIRGLAAESPVFCPWFPRAKNAPISVWKIPSFLLLNKISFFVRVVEPPGNVFRALAGFQNNGSITRFREPIIFLERISIYGRNVKDEEYRHQRPY
jgi:hypothetical protein